MDENLTAGVAVQTPLGKGIVREVRNGRRVLVEVQGRAVVFAEQELSVLPGAKRARAARHTGPGTEADLIPQSRRAGTVPAEVDLHGLTVEEALARAEDALNDALLADVAELRFIHGRSGGRIRGALHQRLRDIVSVRAFRLDPRNHGVTIVTL